MEQLSQLETHLLAKPTRPTSEALDSSVKRKNFMCVFVYFLDLSVHKLSCLDVIEGHLIILLIKSILTRTRLAVVFAFFGSTDFLKSLLLVSLSIDLFVLNYAISFIIRAFSLSVRFFPRPILLDEF